MKHYLKTMNQTLHKRLSMLLLITVISVTGIGVSTPARSATLAGFQSTIIDAPEATLIARRPCKPGEPPHLCTPLPPARVLPNKPEIDKPEIDKPEIDKPEIDKPVINKPEIDKPKINNRVRHQQRQLEQQRELQQQPTAEPPDQN